jgi:DNA-binding transcriptional MerR regulator
MSAFVDTEEATGQELLSVGAVAARLGVAPGTVRSWGRRYGLVPAGRTAGGHRRYTPTDLKTLTIMQSLVGSGTSPSEAARRAMDLMAGDTSAAIPSGPVPTRRRPRPGGPGGQVLSVPNGSPEVRGLARTASRLDADAAMGQLADLFIKRGVVQTWEEVLAPVLVAIGQHWARTGKGVDIEHVLCESTIEALRAYRAFLPNAQPGRPVLLACSPSDQHTLPLHIVAAGLTECRVPVRMLGSRVPTAALTSAARRTGASGVFVWRQMHTPDDDLEDLAQAVRSRARVVFVVGGPGWDQVPGLQTTRVHSLSAAITTLAATAR